MLVTIDQERIVYILADYHLSAAWNVIDVLSNEDSLSLGTRCWLDDPTFLRVLNHGILQANHLIWQYEGQR